MTETLLSRTSGPQGSQGIQGIQGPQGSQGPQGVQGPAGTNGVDGSEIVSSVLSTAYSLTASLVDVPGWSIVVPAGSGVHDVGVPEGIMTNIVTGTTAVAGLIVNDFWILDEANAVIAVAKFGIIQVTAVSKNVPATLPLARSGLPNPATDKTYRVQARCNLAGTLGVAGNIFTSTAGFVNPRLRAIRR